MTPEAKRLFVEFFNEFGAEQDEAEGDLAAAFGKIEGYAPGSPSSITLRMGFWLIRDVTGGTLARNQ